MDIYAAVDLTRRELAMRGLSALSVGDAGVMRLNGIESSDIESLKLVVYRKDCKTKVAEFSGFSVTDGHPLVREVEFAFTGDPFAVWADEDGPGKTDAYVVIEDEDTTWCACTVPFILRPLASSSEPTPA